MGGDRKIGVALDYSSSSKMALQWAVDNLLQKGETLYVIHVMPDKGEEVRNTMWLQSGSPLIPLSEFREPAFTKPYGVECDAGVLDLLDTASRQKEATIVAKIYWGDASPRFTILLGSVTNFVLSHASCPLIIVKDPKFKQ